MKTSFADMKANFADRLAKTSASAGPSSAEPSPRRGSAWQLPTVDMGSLRSAANDLYTKAVTTARGEEPAPSVASKGGSSTTRRNLTPEQRIARFERTLRISPVPLAQLCNLAFIEGVPDGGASSSNLRAITWKLLLRYLPPEHANWQPHLERQRAQYAAFLGELTVDPRTTEGGKATPASGDVESPTPTVAPAGDAEVGPAAATAAATAADHPLATTADSKWAEWHADEELRYEIRKDVDRTLPDYSFFNKEQPAGRLHHEAISRVLFLYAKLNPGIRYVQGMNEVLAPIYYVFCLELDWARKASGEAAGDSSSTTALDEEEEAAAQAAVEADAFFCFTNLMAETRDHFCSKLDHTELGITAKISALEGLIQKKDPELGATLSALRVSPSFYGFRWLTLLMTQEFDLPDVLRLWDSLLSDSRRFLQEGAFDFLLYVGATMVICMRDDILEQNDFAFCVKKLQHFENHIPVHALVARASELYFEDYPELRPEPLVRTATSTSSSTAVSTSTSTSTGGGGPQRSSTM